MNSVDVLATLRQAQEALLTRHAEVTKSAQTGREAVEARVRELAEVRGREDAKLTAEREQEARDTATRQTAEDAAIRERRGTQDAETAGMNRQINLQHMEMTRISGAIAAINLLQCFPLPPANEEPSAAHTVVNTVFAIIFCIEARVTQTYLPEHFESSVKLLQQVFDLLNPPQPPAAG